MFLIFSKLQDQSNNHQYLLEVILFFSYMKISNETSNLVTANNHLLLSTVNGF